MAGRPIRRKARPNGTNRRHISEEDLFSALDLFASDEFGTEDIEYWEEMPSARLGLVMTALGHVEKPIHPYSEEYARAARAYDKRRRAGTPSSRDKRLERQAKGRLQGGLWKRYVDSRRPPPPREFSRGWEDGEQAFDLSMSPDAPEILTQAQLRRSHSEAYSRGYLGAVREGEGDLDEYIELEGSEPSPNPRRRSRRNPFWVTPKGTAVHHTDAQWAGYTDKHPDRVLPRQAERQVRAEGPKKRVAKGWKIKPKEVDGSTRYLIFYKSKNSGKYAMDRNKAAMMTHLLDPRTFRRKTSKS